MMKAPASQEIQISQVKSRGSRTLDKSRLTNDEAKEEATHLVLVMSTLSSASGLHG